MSKALHHGSRKPPFALRWCVGSALAGLSATAWAQEAAAPPVAASEAKVIQLEPIVVVGTTPLLGIGTPLTKVPANVQTIKGSAIEQQHPNDITDYFIAVLRRLLRFAASAGPLISGWPATGG